MLVESKMAGLYGICFSAEAYKKFNVNRITLLPGVNQVDDAHWAEACRNEMIQHLLEEGKLRQLEKAGDKISNMKPDEAVRLVKKTVARELLESWLAGETRGPVAQAVREQIESLKHPAADKKKE